MKDFGEVLHEEFNKIEEYYVPDDKEHIIWDSEINIADEIDKEEIRDNEYQDYLDTLEDGEEPQSLDDFCDELIENGFFDNYEDANLDDLEENILPEIDKQINENYLMLCGGYNSNYPDFKPSGSGGTDFEGIDGFRDYISNFDRVAITSTDGVLGAICGDHDGTVAGQFYTLPDDPKELIKALGLEEQVKEDYADADWEEDGTIGEYDSIGNYRHYDLEDLVEKEYNELITYGGLDVADFQQHLDLMKPIKDTISMYGQKTESKLQETRIPAQKLIDKYKDVDKVTIKEITDDLNSASPEASDETINGLLAQVKDGLKDLGFKVSETELVKENKEIITESDEGPIYYNILHGEDNKYTLLVKTSKRIKGKESDRDDTVLMKLINALEEKELIDPDLAEDLEFGDLRIEWPSTVKFLLDRGFTCYDLTKYKFKENKEVKTEAEEKMYLDGELSNKFEKEVKLDFSNADMGILRLMYRRLDNLLMNVYDNSNADNLEENIKTILSKADVVVNDLPITNTLNEAFNLVNVVRSIVGSKLEEEFGYDFYYDNVYENKQIKTEANQYQELRDKHQKEFNEFPIGFAFSNEQFKEQMEKLGLTADDEDKIVGIGAGGFIKKDDVDKFNEMNKRHRAEEEDAIKNDTTGEGYIKDMFDYELANHEYGYTYDLTDTLASLGLSMEDINKDKRLQNGLNLALKRYDESKELKTEIASRADKSMLDIMNKFIKKNKLDPKQYKAGTFRIRMKDVPPQEVAGIITEYNGMEYGFRYLPLPGSWTITLIQTGASVSEKPYDELMDAINDLPNIDKKIDEYVQTNGDKIDQMTDKFNYITKAIDDVYKAGSVPSLIKAVKNIKGLPENAVKDIIDRINNNLKGDFTVSDYEDVQDMVVSKLQKIKEFNESKKLNENSTEHQEAGVCPVCGNEDLEYTGQDLGVHDSYYYSWVCPKCHSKGREWYEVSAIQELETSSVNSNDYVDVGICPDCGDLLEYDAFVPEGMGAYYEVHCPSCNFSGKEWYDLTFDEHEVYEENK